MTFTIASVSGSKGRAAPQTTVFSITSFIVCGFTYGRAPSCISTISASSSIADSAFLTVLVRDLPPVQNFMRLSSDSPARSSSRASSSAYEVSMPIIALVIPSICKNGFIASTSTQEAPHFSKSLFFVP